MVDISIASCSLQDYIVKIKFFRQIIKYPKVLINNNNNKGYSGLKLNSWRATAPSLAPNHTCLEASSDPEELD